MSRNVRSLPPTQNNPKIPYERKRGNETTRRTNTPTHTMGTAGYGIHVLPRYDDFLPKKSSPGEEVRE